MKENDRFVNKISFVFFIFGVVISILAPFIPFVQYSEELKILILLVVGVFAGLFNITKIDQKDFLVSGGVYVVVVAIFPDLMNGLYLTKLVGILQNIAIFIFPGVIFSALSIIFDKIHIRDNRKVEYKDITADHAWTFVVFAAVIVVFVQIILEFFFETANYTNLLLIMEFVTFAIFLIDLFVLYFRHKNRSQFFKDCWLDIIATIPFSYLKVTKIFRAFKIVRGVSKASKAAKFIKIHKGLKYFSRKSDFNKYMQIKTKKKKKK